MFRRLDDPSVVRRHRLGRIGQLPYFSATRWGNNVAKDNNGTVIPDC